MANVSQAVNSVNSLTTIEFYGQPLLATVQNNTVYTALKTICENIGLDWTAQRQRIIRDEVLNSVACMIKAVGNDGKNREMLCLPIHYLNGWLFGVDVSRVKAEIKQKLITYKKECYQALFDYWNNGVAVNPRATKSDRKPLVQAVNMLVAETGVIYSNVWKMIHQRFDVECVDELTCKQVNQAVEYVHGLILEHSNKSRTLSPELTKLLAVSIERSIEHARVLQRINMYGDDTIYNKIDHIRRHTQQLVQYANAHAKQPVFVNGCLSVGLTRIVYELPALKFMGLVEY